MHTRSLLGRILDRPYVQRQFRMKTSLITALHDGERGVAEAGGAKQCTYIIRLAPKQEFASITFPTNNDMSYLKKYFSNT